MSILIMVAFSLSFGFLDGKASSDYRVKCDVISSDGSYEEVGEKGTTLFYYNENNFQRESISYDISAESMVYVSYEIGSSQFYSHIGTIPKKTVGDEFWQYAKKNLKSKLLPCAVRSYYRQQAVRDAVEHDIRYCRYKEKYAGCGFACSIC